MRARFALIILGAALGGCYVGGAEPFSPSTLSHEPGWRYVQQVPEIRQVEEKDCGAAATAMMLAYWGQPIGQAEIRTASGISPEHGLTADFIRSYVRDHGLDAALFEGTLRDFEHELSAGRPVLVGVAKPFAAHKAIEHYLVVVGFNRARQQVVVIDPADGWRSYSFKAFVNEWLPVHRLTLVVFPTAPAAEASLP